MSATNPSATSVAPYVGSASYAPCTSCGEGSLTWDPDAEANRCPCCGVLEK